MTTNNPERQRLDGLASIVHREVKHLLATQARLFAEPFDAHRVKALETDETLAERVEAFVSRFGRLQDTLGEKFIPALLRYLGEPNGVAIDNLNRAEQLGWMPSVEQWMRMRKLRNFLVHEYVDDAQRFAESISSANHAVPELIAVANALIAELAKRR